MSWSLQIWRSDVQLYSSISSEIDTANYNETIDIIPRLQVGMDDIAAFTSTPPSEGDEYRLFLGSQHYATGMFTDVGNEEEGSRNILGVDWTHYVLGPKITRRFPVGLDYGFMVRDSLQRYAPKAGTNYVFDLGITNEHVVEVTRRELLDTIINLAELANQEWLVDQNKNFLLFREDFYPILHDGFTTSKASNNKAWSAVSGFWTYDGSVIIGNSADVPGFSNDDDGTWTGTRYFDGKILLASNNSKAYTSLFREEGGGHEIYVHFPNTTAIQLWRFIGFLGSTISAAVDVSVNSFHTHALIVTESNYEVFFDGQSVIRASSTFGMVPIGKRGFVYLRSPDGGQSKWDDMRWGEKRILELTDASTQDHVFPPQQIEKVAKVTVLGGPERLTERFDQDLSQWNFTPGFEIKSEDDDLKWSRTGTGLFVSKIDKYQNFEYIVKGIVHSGNDLSLVWRFVNSDNYYLFRATEFTGSSQWDVSKVFQGSTNPIARGEFDGILPTNSKEYFVQAQGGTHRVGVDNGVLYEFNDLDLTRGAVGVKLGSGSYTIQDIDLESEARVVGTKSDPTLQGRWGDKNKQLSFPDIHTISEANKRAEVELNLLTSPPLRGDVLTDGSYGARPPSTVFCAFPQFNISSMFKVITTEQILGEEDWQTRYKLVQITPYIEEFLARLKEQTVASEAQIEREEILMSLLGSPDSFMTNVISISKRTRSYRDINQRIRIRTAPIFKDYGERSRYSPGFFTAYRDIGQRMKIQGVMAKVGHLNTGTATGTLAVTGLGFRPKVVIFWGTKATGGADATGTGASFSIGAAESSTKRWAMWGEDLDAQASAISDSKQDNTKCYIIWTAGTPVVDGEMDFVSMDDDGFTVDRTNAFSADYRVNYLAIGGPGLKNVDVNTFQNTASGSQVITTPQFQPTFLLLGCIGAADNTSITDFQMGLGWAIGSATADQFTATGITEDAQVAATRRYAFQGECLSLTTTSAADEVTRRGSLTSFDSLGFTINWLETPGTNQRLNYVALNIDKVATGTYATLLSPGNILLETNFYPKLLLSLSHLFTLPAQDTGQTGMEFLLGASSDKDTERSVYITSLDTGGTTDTAFADRLAKHYINYSGAAPTLEAEADVTVFRDSGVTINQTDADASSVTVGWVAFGG